ncbi:MAG: hypothetical protein WD276_09055 [Actinomycetota bacterium]
MGESDQALDPSLVFRRVLPVASVAFIVVGLALIVFSLFSGGRGTTPSPPARVATIDLRNGMSVARSFFQEQKRPSFFGFGVAEAEGREPSIRWNKAESAVAGEVSIRIVNRTNLVLASMDIATGKAYCIAWTKHSGTTMGTEDAAKPAGCVGGWGQNKATPAESPAGQP